VRRTVARGATRPPRVGAEREVPPVHGARVHRGPTSHRPADQPDGVARARPGKSGAAGGRRVGVADRRGRGRAASSSRSVPARPHGRSQRACARGGSLCGRSAISSSSFRKSHPPPKPPASRIPPGRADDSGPERAAGARKKPRRHRLRSGKETSQRPSARPGLRAAARSSNGRPPPMPGRRAPPHLLQARLPVPTNRRRHPLIRTTDPLLGGVRPRQALRRGPPGP